MRTPTPSIPPFLPPKRRSPSPFCRCHGPESPPVFSRVQGIILDSRAQRRLALWDNPCSRLGRSTQFLVILGAPQGEDPAAPLRGSLPARRRRPSERSPCPGDGRCCPAAAQQWPAGRGGAGTWAAIPGPLPSPWGACVCACVREVGATSHRRGVG